MASINDPPTDAELERFKQFFVEGIVAYPADGRYINDIVRALLRDYAALKKQVGR